MYRFGLGVVPVIFYWPFFCTAWDYLVLKTSYLVSDLSLFYRLDEVCCPSYFILHWVIFQNVHPDVVLIGVERNAYTKATGKNSSL